LWRRVCCRLGRHRLFKIARCGCVTDHVGCRDCAKQWGMNHDVRAILPWSIVGPFHIERGYDPTAALAKAHNEQVKQ
jgi:hypothetical protein